MRSMSVLIMAGALAGCTTAPPPPTDLAESQAKLQNVIQGRVAGQPINCLPSYQSRNARMVVIDNQTVAFQVTGGPTYINHLEAGACSGLDSGFYQLVTNSYGSLGLCSGDTARVVDTRNGVGVGSCVIGDFTPYTRAAT